MSAAGRVLASIGFVLFGVLGSTTGCRPELPALALRALPLPDGKPALLPGARGPLSDRVASYAIHAKLDTATHRISATETLRWKHDGVAPVASVPLHLYMNAFKSDATAFMREARTSPRFTRANGAAPGWIEVPSIVHDGVEVRDRARFGEDETTLEVPLAAPVAPGVELVLEIRFEVQLPELVARTGYQGAFHMLGQWFPKIGVLTVEGGAQRWHCDTFHANSEFFADFGVYDVDLDVPDDVVVAASGVLAAARELGGGRRLLTYRAEDVHDFAWMADPYMQVLVGLARSDVGEVEVRIYHRPAYAAYAARHLEAARRTVATFGRLFGAYPWSVLSVIDTPLAALNAGGMEYPTLVTTLGDVALEGAHVAEQVTIHEVGHNWFQGMLASNEVDEAFLDEGVNEYADGLVMDEMFGAAASEVNLPWLHLGYWEIESLPTDAGRLVSPIATRSYEFAPHEYGPATYAKTAQVLKTLEWLAGREALLRALGRYARSGAFHHPTRADLFAAFDAGLGGDFGWFYRPAFLEPGGVDFVLADIDDKPGDQRLTVANVGRLPCAADVVVRFADGTAKTVRWDGRGGWHSFVFTEAAQIAGAEIDPEHHVLLEHERLGNGVEPARLAPSARAAARIGFWAQTLEQVVGL